MVGNGGRYSGVIGVVAFDMADESRVSRGGEDDEPDAGCAV